MPLILSPNLPSATVFDRARPDLFPVYSQLESDVATTGTRLDLLPAIIEADAGLPERASPAEIETGAEAANRMNEIIVDQVSALGLAADGVISAEDVRALNLAIQTDDALRAEWIALHGREGGGEETGIHTVVGDGALTRLFGVNAVNGVLDGLFHLGLEIDPATDRFEDQSGSPSVSVDQVADVLTYLLGDLSTTGTGLDLIVDTALVDDGLARWTSAGDILGGAEAADGMNRILLESIEAIGADADGIITAAELEDINALIRGDAALLADWTALHGDDEGGVSTGFHLIQGNGAETQLGGRNLINTVADGLYHVGFEIDPESQRFRNEDGDLNASTGQVASWLTELLYDIDVVLGTSVDDRLVGSGAGEDLRGEAGDDVILGGAGADMVAGGEGADRIEAGLGSDMVDAGAGADQVLSLSWGGEPAIAQDAEIPKVEPDEPLDDDDDIALGAGADTLIFRWLLDATPEILDKHRDPETGDVNYRAVAGENGAVHDHWVETIGNDIVRDYDPAEDTLRFQGHTVALDRIETLDADGDGAADDSIAFFYSEQGGAGAHQGDALGSVTFIDHLIAESEIQISTRVFFGVEDPFSALG